MLNLFSCTLISLENAISHLRLVSGRDCKKVFCKSLEINVLQSEDRWGMVCWFFSFCFGLVIGVGFQSENLTLEGEIIGLIRNLTNSEINCKAGNSNRLIDNTVSISLNKGPERWVPYLIEILCSFADLTASLFQWNKSIHIFQPRIMSGSFSWFQKLSNLCFGWQWSNMNIFKQIFVLQGLIYILIYENV